ncbi:Uncharacterised protein [Amycolatopsis camponoti]|uniref:S-adenosyl methyltransferase n=1 Tax=Amycolatopsis camponoti TaxID=2606593 RepID=A0A6I8M4V6_9PSEU|nr:SAM-dependent methyltransferase [Amycolatopsis camponoti]VVJ22663.1 Uncharacterised protein [Amycolatopsis camponoti]
MTAPGNATTTGLHHKKVGVDLESPRRDPVGDYLLGGSINSAADRAFAADLVAAHPKLPQLTATAARWDHDAAQLMLDQGTGHFLILGTGGMPLWASHTTLASLHAARARIVVLEHDPITRHLHDLVDGGDAADRALVLHVPAERHHVLPQLPEVAELLASGTPVGILATGLLRPAGITLATILSLLTAAPPGSWLALTQLTTGHPDNDIAGVAARFADAGIPIAVAAPRAFDAAIAPFRLRSTVDEGDAAETPSPSTAPGMQTMLLTANAAASTGRTP